jgi:hypothetical protein
MTHDDLMNFITRGRVAQEEVDKIITTYTQAKALAGGHGVAVCARPGSYGETGPRQAPSVAPPTVIGVNAGLSEQRGAPRRRAPAPNPNDRRRNYDDR